MLSFSLPKTSGKTVLPLVTAAVWTLAVAGMAYWVLQWPKAEPTATIPVPVSLNQVTDLHAPLARALGQPTSLEASTAPQTQTSYILMGVIASSSGQGSALIGMDGQPPKAYRVGQTVQDGWTLVSLTARQARLRSSGAEVVLDLPVTDKP